MERSGETTLPNWVYWGNIGERRSRDAEEDNVGIFGRGFERVEVQSFKKKSTGQK